MPHRPTPYVDLNEVLDALVAGVKEALQDKLLEIYLQGSFAVGDFDDHSDVDFIVVLADELSDGEVQRLSEMHKAIYATPCEWAKHLEGSYFPIDTLAKPPAGKVWYLDHGHTTLERSTHCNTYVVRWSVQHFGISLLHPESEQRGWGPLAGKLPEIRTEDLRNEMKTTLVDWGNEILSHPQDYENRFYQGFIVLNYCRMLRDIETATVGSKKMGAEWAKANLHHEWHDLIERAWLCRPNPSVSSRTPPDPTDFSRTLAFVQFAIDRTRKETLDPT